MTGKRTTAPQKLRPSLYKYNGTYSVPAGCPRLSPGTHLAKAAWSNEAAMGCASILGTGLGRIRSHGHPPASLHGCLLVLGAQPWSVTQRGQAWVRDCPQCCCHACPCSAIIGAECVLSRHTSGVLALLPHHPAPEPITQTDQLQVHHFFSLSR